LVRVAQLAAAVDRSVSIASIDWRAISIAAVSMMSWLVAPRWIASAAWAVESAGSSPVSVFTSAGTGLPVDAAAADRFSFTKKSTRATAVTAAPGRGGASRARSAGRASADSVASIACSQASLLVSAAPRSKSAPNRELLTLPSCRLAHGAHQGHHWDIPNVNANGGQVVVAAQRLAQVRRVPAGGG